MAEQGDSPPPGTPAVDPEESAGEQGASNGDSFAEHPELFVGAAFVGGFALAKLLRRMGQ